MFDAQCDLAALVYERDQDPDEVLRDFSSDLNARGYRAVGLVQTGHHCLDAPRLSAMLVHTGEELQLLQNLGTCATGCRLDVGQLMDAGAQIASAIDRGADLVIVNRFGRQECEGKGLSYLVDRALSADIPVVIAVPRLHGLVLYRDRQNWDQGSVESRTVLAPGFALVVALECRGTLNRPHANPPSMRRRWQSACPFQPQARRSPCGWWRWVL